MDNPLGGIKRGWSEIRSVYERLFRHDGTYHFEFYDYTLHQSSDIFYAVGRERGYVSRHGAKLDMKIRTTRVFRFDGQRWRQVHHHGSIDDPQLLAAYQAAVR
jgi:ketosteroid isomerase-like protein